MEKATLGTVIHGTLRSQDLIPAFMETIKILDPDRHLSLIRSVACDDPDLIGTVCHRSGYAIGIDACDDHPWWNSESASYLIGDSVDVLNDHAPAFCYFGAHEGDGSDFGFWPCMDSIEMAVVDREAVQVSDLAEIPQGWIGDTFIVNDHGNLTCGHVDQAGKFHSEWAIV